MLDESVSLEIWSLDLTIMNSLAISKAKQRAKPCPLDILLALKAPLLSGGVTVLP